MRKFSRLIFFFTVFLFLLFLFPKKSYADQLCALTSPQKGTVTTNTKRVNLIVKAEGLVEGNFYTVRLGGVNKVRIYKFPSSPQKFEYKDKQIAVGEVDAEGAIDRPNDKLPQFKEITYTVEVLQEEQNVYCSDTFAVTKSTENTSGCSIEYLTPDGQFKPNTEIWIKVNNLSEMDKTDYRHHALLKRNHENGPTILEGCYLKSELAGLNNVGGISLGKRELGDYYFEVRNACNWNYLGESRICSSKFSITLTGQQVSSPSAAPCSEKKDGLCIAMETPFGKIKTKPDEFIKSIFGLLLGISGGIALLLIIVSGYQLMASQGNPEKVQGAKERLTSAIVGLLFIIFSFVILEVIGVDILNIPGFTR